MRIIITIYIIAVVFSFTYFALHAASILIKDYKYNFFKKKNK